MNATALLRKDHAAVKKLFNEFSGTTSRATKKRVALIEKIAVELTVHAKIEEEIFYPAMRRLESARPLVDEAEREHAEVKSLIATLQALDPTSESAERTVEQMKSSVLHHATEEEREMFPKAEALGRGELERLGAELAERKRELMRSPLVFMGGRLAALPTRTIMAALAAVGGLWVAYRAARKRAA